MKAWVTGLLIAATSGSVHARPPSPAWTSHEFAAPPSTGLPLAEVERYLNETCRSSGVDGVQIFGVQKGNGGDMFLHLYCRQDGAHARYRVSAPTFAIGGMDAAVEPFLHQPQTRIGPFYFGNPGTKDAVIVIQRVSM